MPCWTAWSEAPRIWRRCAPVCAPCAARRRPRIGSDADCAAMRRADDRDRRGHAPAQPQPSFVARVDRTQVGAGESFTLEITLSVEGGRVDGYRAAGIARLAHPGRTTEPVHPDADGRRRHLRAPGVRLALRRAGARPRQLQRRSGARAGGWSGAAHRKDRHHRG